MWLWFMNPNTVLTHEPNAVLIHKPKIQGSASLLHNSQKPLCKCSISLHSRFVQGQIVRLKPSKTPFFSGGCATGTWSSAANGWNVGYGSFRTVIFFPYINKGSLFRKHTFFASHIQQLNVAIFLLPPTYSQFSLSLSSFIILLYYIYFPKYIGFLHYQE